MIERFVCVTLLLLAQPLVAAEPLRIGYLEVAADPRYAERSAYARIQLRSESRPLPGAQLGIEDARTVGEFAGMAFNLQHFRGEDLPALLSKVEEWQGAGIHFVLLDLPAVLSAELAAQTRTKDLLLFNVSAASEALRNARCQPQLLHTLPSHSMLTDALVQYLVSKRWRDLLVLQGPLPEDAEWVAALEHSAERFGAKLIDIRPFELGNDPRRRERNNIPLLTANGSYDVAVVADSEGEFGRYVPYQTKAARPVVGSTGLVTTAWTWVWERHGAPQVSERFRAHADRPMQAADWAAWVAVKAITQSAIRTQSVEFLEVARYLRSEELNLDGSKGPALSFRPWNNQLRQPILLTTHDAVIARAPLAGFLHPRNNLDTLGDDRGDTHCSFDSSRIKEADDG